MSQHHHGSDRRLVAAVISLLLSVTGAFFLFINPAAAALKDQVRETILPNGLKVILLENHKAPFLTFQVWYRVGSRNEAWGKTGISHLLEHMMFKGTEKVGPERFSKIIQENGGNDNAFTSTDYTAYFENISGDRVEIPISLESDRMVNLVLREEDFRTEQMVVIEERRLRTEDNPQAYVYEQLGAAGFQIHPYHWPIIGWMTDIKSITLEDLKVHYRTYYSPGNAFIVVVGDFKPDSILSAIDKAFGTIPKAPLPDQQRPLEQPQTGERRVMVRREALTPFLAMGYHVPNLLDRDSYVLEVITAILAEGKTSRLYKNIIREQRLALRVDVDNSLTSRDPGFFYISAEPMPGKDASELEKALDREIEHLQKEPLTHQELEKVINQLEASFVYAQDSFFSQAMILARHEIASDWRKVDDYVPAIRKVSPDDIMRVARKYLVPDNRTVAVLVPLPPKEGKEPLTGSPGREEFMR